MNFFVCLVLALIRPATYAIPITNDKLQPPSTDVTLRIEPRTHPACSVVGGCIVATVPFEVGVRCGRLVGDIFFADMQDKAIMFSHEFNNFVQEAVGLDGFTPLQMPHDMGGEPNDDGPLRVKFILPHGPGVTHVEHDPGTACKALKKILSRNVPGRKVEMPEEGQLLSSNGVFGVAINSGFTVKQRNLPGFQNHWIQGPCYLWFRVWEGSGNVYAVFISHANPGPHRARTVDVCRPNAAAPYILGQVMHAVNCDFFGGPGERLERFTPP